MEQIAELERRLSVAMGRIGRALDALPAAEAGVPAEAFERACADAEAAQAAAASALERAKAAETDRARTQAELEAEAAAAEALRTEIAGLKELHDSQQARIASLEANIDELVSLRTADRAELEEILAALEPLIREQSDA